MPDVIIVGAGPVGMLMAGELARLGVDVVVLERRAAIGAGSRAIGLHPPALAALEPTGVTQRLLDGAVRVRRGEARARGQVIGVVRFDRCSARFPFVATLPQAQTEAVLATRAPDPRRGATVTGVLAERDGVRVRGKTAGEQFEVTADLVVVASGAASRELVYRAAALRRREYRDRYLMTDAAPAASDASDVAVVHLDRAGVLESFPLPGGKRRFVAWDAPDADPDPQAQSARLRAAIASRGAALAGDEISATGFGVRRVIAPRMRNGRVFVIGDAAHEVSPIGGQGLNLGLLDAARLAPLLAVWVRTGDAPEAELRQWERRRLASTRTAARLAAVNTRLGRPMPPALDLARRVAIRTMLTPLAEPVFARTYAMGLDRDA